MSKYNHDAAAALLRSQKSTYEKPWYKSCSEVLVKKNIRGKRCLDLCSGNGEFSEILRDRFDMDVVCADYIPHHLEQSHKNGFETIEINLEADESTIKSIAANYMNSFDIVVSLATIEHIFNTSSLVGFSHDVLKSGGYFLVNTPNIAFSAYLLYSLLSGRPFGEGHHVRFWDYRFLRTNLFLYGFNDFEDYRKFYSLPFDPVLRACRNKKFVARIISLFFHSCQVLQYIPFLKGLCCDELTVLCRKENTPIIGFEFNEVSRILSTCIDEEASKKMKDRLRIARSKGWLDEHLYLARLVDELD